MQRALIAGTSNDRAMFVIQNRLSSILFFGISLEPDRASFCRVAGSEPSAVMTRGAAPCSCRSFRINFRATFLFQQLCIRASSICIDGAPPPVFTAPCRDGHFVDLPPVDNPSPGQPPDGPSIVLAGLGGPIRDCLVLNADVAISQ